MSGIILMERGSVGAQIEDDARLITEQDLELDVGDARALILCSALPVERVRREVDRLGDRAWIVGRSTACTSKSSTLHRHWALSRAGR
jgi:hypothetical protein